ncbi:MAG TPA: TRAP transporter substrate-binding protein DctP [Treponema sp.]|nr:TRAP transporter substrate-binding protein DctP [Treponema sp.]
MFSKKILCFLLCLLVLAGGVFAQKPIRLKIASMAPSRSPWDIEQRALAQEWSKITNGLVSVTFYDTLSLGGEKSVIQKIRSIRPGQRALLDGAIFSTIGLHELAPSASIYTLSIPFLIQNQENLDLVLDKFDYELKSEYRKSGFEVIAWTNVGWLSFYTKDSYSDLEGLKRIQIASAGLDSPVLGDSFRAAGFTIEDMPADKVLQSLSSSSGVRGFFGVHLYAYVTGLSKKIDYALQTKLCPVLAGLVISSDTWAKIPNEYKPAMLDAVERMRQRLSASLEDSDQKYIANMKKDGVTFISPTNTELAQWESIFAGDIEKITQSSPDAFSKTLYQNIQNMLGKNRN